MERIVIEVDEATAKKWRLSSQKRRNKVSQQVNIILGKLAFSNATMDEFVEVLFRKKFDKYFLNDEEKYSVIQTISLSAVFFPIAEIITGCRDPKDNKFLELAVEANASCIVTGDKDLLVLDPFRGIPILTAADLLKKF